MTLSLRALAHNTAAIASCLFAGTHRIGCDYGLIGVGRSVHVDRNEDVFGTVTA